jgi:hypothetical protein
MAGPKLDGAGTAKMATLEAATKQLQRLHAVVEQCAIAVKSKAPAAPFMPGIRRAAQPLVGLLKGQFGMISDQAAAFLLSATRPGGNDITKLRTMRDGVSQLRVQMELAVAKVLDLHTVEADHSTQAGD